MFHMFSRQRISHQRLSRSLLLAACCGASVASGMTLGAVAAEAQQEVQASDPARPFGTIAVTGDQTLTVAFPRPVQLPLGSVVFIYGPGKVEYHPLDKNTIIKEHRKIVAKAQVLEKMADSGYRVKVFWLLEDTQLETGFDAIPEPDATVPDVPPVFQADSVTGFKARVQETVIIRLPIVDPEKRPLRFQWSLADANSGRLSSATTGEPVIRWTAPGMPVTTTLTVTATDAASNTASWKVPLEVSPLGQDWRDRQLTVEGRFGDGVEPALTVVERDDRGYWWGIDKRSQIVQISPGWADQKVMTQLSETAGLRSPIALGARGQDLIVLDGGQSMGFILSHTGVERGRLQGLDKPVDLAISPLGTIAVADQGLGGVAIYDEKGSYRMLVGRVGDGGYGSVDRVAFDQFGNLLVMDKVNLKVYRYDPVFNVLPSFSFKGNDGVIDMAPSPRGGTMVLMPSGKILQLDDEGVARTTLVAVGDDRLMRPDRAPTSLSVDAFGTAIAAFPDLDRLVRYDVTSGRTGVRGAGLWTDHTALSAIDKRGYMCSLNPRTGEIFHYDAQGWLRQVISWQDEEGDNRFEDPVAVALSSDGKYFTVLDADRYQVVRFDLTQPQSRPVRFGQRGKNIGQFDEPEDVAVDAAGRIYVTDSDLHKVKVFDKDGGNHMEFGVYDRGRTDEELDEPTTIAVSSDGATVFVYDADKYHIKKYSIDHQARVATLVGMTGTRGSKDLGQLARPNSMAVDAIGLLYIGDGSRRDVQVWDFRGNNAVALLRQDARELELGGLESIDVAADGLLLMSGDDGVRRLNWYQENR